MFLGPYLLVLVCLAPLTIRAAPMLETEQAEHHSVQKRQTTVTFTSKYEDIRELVINIVVSFTFAFLAVVLIAPLFGYKLDLLVSSFEDEPLEAPLTNAYSYGSSATGRRLDVLQEEEMPWYRRLVTSIDLVDTSLNYMEVEGEDCRRKAICELEYAAVSNPIARLGINTLNSNLWGLEKYSDAVEAGLSGQDCAFLYSECRSPSYAGQFSLF